MLQSLNPLFRMPLTDENLAFASLTKAVPAAVLRRRVSLKHVRVASRERHVADPQGDEATLTEIQDTAGARDALRSVLSRFQEGFGTSDYLRAVARLSR